MSILLLLSFAVIALFYIRTYARGFLSKGTEKNLFLGIAMTLSVAYYLALVVVSPDNSLVEIVTTSALVAIIAPVINFITISRVPVIFGFIAMIVSTILIFIFGW